MEQSFNPLKVDTKTRILDAAERLFGQSGVDGTSLRDITKEAGVNLAAVNYHFQSRESLISAVVSRRITPITERRLRMLDEFEASPDGLTPERVAEAFLIPLLEAGDRDEFLRPMMGRMLSAPNDFLNHVFKTHLAGMAVRFLDALGKTLPGVPHQELVWRLHFMAGVVSHIIAWSRVLPTMTGGVCDLSDTDALSKRMTAFVAAGLRAPAPR